MRRGETEANVTGLYSGYTPTSLTERGIAQTQTLDMLLRHVPAGNVLYSELGHAHHTMRLILGDHGVPVRSIPKLNEILFGDWEMRHHHDLAQEDAGSYAVWCNSWQNTALVNGEGFQTFSQRVERSITQFADYKTS